MTRNGPLLIIGARYEPTQPPIMPPITIVELTIINTSMAGQRYPLPLRGIMEKMMVSLWYKQQDGM
ncbi:hypothetical protein BHU09_09285 [Tannerella sp. oral taxon 808]|nr:hypothetical protein BHU09_09285 [Tannerella sp. oral taxon 808]